MDETQISVDSPIQIQIQSEVNEPCSAPQASVSSSATINNKRSPESEDIAPKRQKKENSVREDFLQIAKKQADAMLVSVLLILLYHFILLLYNIFLGFSKCTTRNCKSSFENRR